MLQILFFLHLKGDLHLYKYSLAHANLINACNLLCTLSQILVYHSL